MHTPLKTLAFMCFCSPAMAECPPAADSFLSCTLAGGRQYLDVCVDSSTVTYAFGYTGRPADLALSVPIEQANFEPWPGVGLNMYETMVFTKGDISYAVIAGTSRPVAGNTEDQETQWGEVEIIQNRNDLDRSEYIATLICDERSSNYRYGRYIYDAKTAAGQCWDYPQKQWVACS